MLPGLSGSSPKLWLNRCGEFCHLNNTRCHLNPINRKSERGLTAFVDLKTLAAAIGWTAGQSLIAVTDAIAAEARNGGLVADGRWLGEGLLFDKLAAIIHRRAFQAIVTRRQPANIYAVFVALRDREVGGSRGR